MKKRLIIGMSGASGAPLTVLLLEQLKCCAPQIETHLIVTESAQLTLSCETDLNMEDLSRLADVVYDNHDMGASVASGSFRTEGMIIVPCSMKTLAGIVTGYSDNLLLRSADVVLKERRKLVVVPRECPLGTIHLRNMYELSQLGGIVIPPVLSFYHHPGSVKDCSVHIIGKILDQFDIPCRDYQRWS